MNSQIAFNSNNEGEILPLLAELKNLLIQKNIDLSICPEWIPKSTVKKYLGYGDTQFATLILNKDLVIAKIGRRVFVNRTSLMKLLEANIQ